MGTGKLLIGTLLGTTILIVGLFILISQPATSCSKDELITTTTSVLGAKDAKVTLIQFSAFQCPACKAYKPVVDEIMKKYHDQILFGYRHFPLPHHHFAAK